MSGYLDRLVGRTLGLQRTLQPRPRSRFEPAPDGGPVAGLLDGQDAPAGAADTGGDGDGGGDRGRVRADRAATRGPVAAGRSLHGGPGGGIDGEPSDGGALAALRTVPVPTMGTSDAGAEEVQPAGRTAPRRTPGPAANTGHAVGPVVPGPASAGAGLLAFLGPSSAAGGAAAAGRTADGSSAPVSAASGRRAPPAEATGPGEGATGPGEGATGIPRADPLGVGGPSSTADAGLRLSLTGPRPGTQAHSGLAAGRPAASTEWDDARMPVRAPVVPGPATADVTAAPFPSPGRAAPDGGAPGTTADARATDRPPVRSVPTGAASAARLATIGRPAPPDGRTVHGPATAGHPAAGVRPTGEDRADAPPPTVTVTIGRVEVRTPPPPPPVAPEPAPRPQQLSLGAYLDRRNSGSR